MILVTSDITQFIGSENLLPGRDACPKDQENQAVP